MQSGFVMFVNTRRESRFDLRAELLPPPRIENEGRQMHPCLHVLPISCRNLLALRLREATPPPQHITNYQ